MKSKSPMETVNKTSGEQKENVDAAKASWKLEADMLMNAIPALNEGFVIKHKIGEGTFSSVYLGTILDCPDKLVAIKHVIPTSHPKRICMELECMQKFGGQANIIKIDSCVRVGSHFVMIMPFFRHNKLGDLIGEMDLKEIREYLRNLLEALKCVHAGGVIHRDVKPSNFLYNRNLKRFALIDFGLAQYADSRDLSSTKESKKLRSSDVSKDTTLPMIKRRKGCGVERTIGSDLNINSSSNSNCTIENGNSRQASAAWMRLVPSTRGISSQLTVRSSSSLSTSLNLNATRTCDCFSRPQVCRTCLKRPQQTAARAGTPGYRPPEVLFKHPEQTVAVDVWAVGIIFFSLLSERYPLFEAQDDLSALAELISLFGTSKVREFAARIGKTLICSPEHPSRPLSEVCDKMRPRRPTKTSPSQDKNDDEDHDFDRTDAYDLLCKLLQLDPTERMTAADALQHPFFDVSDGPL